jgi:nucleotide-binding universal stress UspA family protein
MLALLSQAEFHNVPYEGIVKIGEVWETLQELSDTLDSNVIVVGTHGRRGLKKSLMGAVAEEVLRLSRIPVLTVGPQCEIGKHRITRILCANDFSPDSVRALTYAASLAETFNATLIVNYVVPLVAGDPSSRARSEQFFNERLQELVSCQASSLKHVEYWVEFGAPSDGILGAASSAKADLIVMGVRGIGSIHRASHRVGNTADEVVGSACCPVLTVRRLG